ncbi:MAG: hypothetical protein R2724_14670 [Bryobacterales bacterium]
MDSPRRRRLVWTCLAPIVLLAACGEGGERAPATPSAQAEAMEQTGPAPLHEVTLGENAPSSST